MPVRPAAALLALALLAGPPVAQAAPAPAPESEVAPVTEPPAAAAPRAERQRRWAPAPPVRLLGVEVEGLPEAERENVRLALGFTRLTPAQRARMGEARLRFLSRRAEAEAAAALEPFGYYAPRVEVRRVAEADGVRIVVQVEAGEPVRVARLDARMAGEAEGDAAVAAALATLGPKPGEVLVHAEYEAGKQRVDRLLAERGYFDARLERHRVEVRRAAHSADIALFWNSGPRHRLGEARFAETGFREGLFDPFVEWSPGDPYERGKLSRLQQRLAALDYFALVEVAPDEEGIDEDLRVPVDVRTTPAKRTTYTAALSFGTDTGLGLRGGLNRRWVNARGHKWLAEAEWSELRTSLSTQYRVPAFRVWQGWYAAEGGLVREDPTTALGFERASLRAGWRGQREPWTLGADLVAARERAVTRSRIASRAANLAYPELSLQYRRMDDPLSPESGWHGRALLRGGLFDSEAGRRDFLQVQLGALWVWPVGERQRLVLRGEFGTTRLDGEDAVLAYPTSLRFFVGGDRSIRGYGYREVGPRFEGQVIGGLHMAVASVELQHFLDDQWGVALFADAGDAANTRRGLDPKLGVGVGARWRSPVGLLGVDVAQGLDREAGGGTRLHISFGISF